MPRDKPRLAIVWSSSFFGLAYARYKSAYGIPGNSAATVRPHIDMFQDQVISKGEWRVRDHGIDATKLWLGYSAYAQNELTIDPDSQSDKVGSRFTNRDQERKS